METLKTVKKNTVKPRKQTKKMYFHSRNLPEWQPGDAENPFLHSRNFRKPGKKRRRRRRRKREPNSNDWNWANLENSRRVPENVNCTMVTSSSVLTFLRPCSVTHNDWNKKKLDPIHVLETVAGARATKKKWPSLLSVNVRT